MSDVAEAVQKGLQVVANLPEEVHWLCEKVEPGPGGRQTIPDEDAATRADSTMHSMMLLSFSDQEANQQWLKGRINEQLTRCARCVEEFYSLKRRFYQKLLPEHGQENLDLFFTYLEDWDIERVEPVLSEAVKDLDRATSPTAWYEKLQKNPSQLNAIHECFCSPGLLRSPSIKASISRICTVKQLDIQGPAAGLITFLFMEDKALRSLAEKSWKSRGPSITVPIFESHLLGPLESATRKAQEELNPERLGRFFRGISIIVQNVGPEIIKRCISGAERDPIKLAVHRIQPNLPFWHPILRLFQSLMVKLRRDVWEVISPLTPSGFGDVIFHDRLFGKLLRDTEQGAGGESQLLDLTEWMSEYIYSIEPLLRPTTAPSLIRQIFRNDLPALTRGLCFKEGMKVLNSTLRAIESEIVSGNVLVRQANDLFMEHQQSVIEVAFLNEIFEDKLMEKHMLIAQRAAQATMISALKLDVQFIAADFECLFRKKPPMKPIYQMNIRANLWDVVSKRFPLNDSEFCMKLIQAIKSVLEIDQVYISPKDVQFNEEKTQFNTRLSNIDQPLASILRSMSRGTLPALDQVLSDQPTFEVLLGLMMSRSEDVAMSAEDVALTGLKAEDKVDAFRLMLVKDFSVPILSLTSISRHLSKWGLFAMMPRWVKIGMNVLDLLCDRTEGIIRKSDMQTWERTMLRVYWDTQWRCLGTIFKRSRRWALSEDKFIMIEFLRNSMDYAETLFDNFWTFEQALTASTENTREPWSHRLLQDASKALNPFTSILSIQDEHLLQTCQKLMCKMLGLLAENEVPVADEGFFVNLKRYLYPESFPDYDASKTTPTNLTVVQKTELTVAASRLSPDFLPVQEKTVIELTDDEYGSSDIADEDMVKAANVVAEKKQSKLDFQPAPRWSESKLTAPKKPTPPPRTVGDPLRSKKTRDTQAFLEKRKADLAALEKRKQAAIAQKPKTEVLESSDDDSDSDDGGNTLFKLGSRTKTEVKDAKTVGAPRKAAPRKLPAIRRVKDTRARVAPDMSGLYKQIFQWDFFHDDAFPPGLSSSNYTHVAKSFSSFGAYLKTFEPLLLLEAWQSFLKCKEEAMPSGCLEIKIATRMRSDHFVELETTIDNIPDRNRWYEADVVLLSSSKDPLRNTGEPHCIARVHTVNRKFTGKCEVSLRCDPGPAMLQNHMRTNGTLYGIKIMNLTPLEREYASLICMQYYDLREEILTAKPSPLVEPTEAQVTKTKDLYNVNEPQAKAIIAAVSSTGFTLIQGPPGTGKTKTVVGIAGALLSPGSDDMIQIRGAPPVKKTAAKKILVCAPSNAAVDELVIRFKRGLQSTKGDIWTPSIVRLGRSDAINAEVRDVTLEELIDARMTPTTNASKGSALGMEDLRAQHTKAVEERNAKQQQLDDARAKKLDPSDLLSQIDRLNTTIREQRRQLDIQRDQRKESGRNAEILRRQVQQQIINESQIICATLSGAGHEMLRNVNVDFETVIIDEAAQSVELSALIPLKFGCDKCILVGDPQQLPPTVLSRHAAKFSYEKSLFVRMQENYPRNVHLLSIQYRMHSAISAFPSREFYDSGLKDGDGMADLRRQPWHDSTVFGPYRFFNIAGLESRQKTSLINPEEARMALALFHRITEDFMEVNFDGRIGIVTPYREQLGELKRVFKSRYGEKILIGVEFNTVDAFQGRERDIIIFSCVRAAAEGGVGFLSDIRRMNVGLTRAKSSLFILGSSDFLVRNHMWKRLVEDAKERDVFTPNVRGLFDRSTPRQGMENSRPNQVPQGPRGPSGQPPPQQSRDWAQPPPRTPQNKDGNITCHGCGMKGHRRVDCPKERRNHDPQIPTLEGATSPVPQQLKRSGDFDNNNNEPPNKKIHATNNNVSTAAGGPSVVAGSGVGLSLLLLNVSADM
ncbi:SEN1 N terminal-domain-containing protein [Trichophaea hybrida]|nr:SEN1 N terminal-domain-containing protein [Trichophaea hybrida]